jgi:hypothetical protein
LLGAADWLGIASSTEPFFEIRLPDGRSGAAFVSNFDQAANGPAGHDRRGRHAAVRLMRGQPVKRGVAVTAAAVAAPQLGSAV